MKYTLQVSTLCTAVMLVLVGFFGFVQNASAAFEEKKGAPSISEGLSNGSLKSPCYEDHIHGVPYQIKIFPEFGNDVIEVSTSTNNFIYGFTTGTQPGRGDTVFLVDVDGGDDLVMNQIQSIELAVNQTRYNEVFKDKEFLSVRVNYTDSSTEFIDLAGMDILPESTLFDGLSDTYSTPITDKKEIGELIGFLIHEGNLKFGYSSDEVTSPLIEKGDEAVFVLGLTYVIHDGVFKKARGADPRDEDHFVLKNISDYLNNKKNKDKFDVSLAHYFEKLPSVDLTCLNTPDQFVLKNYSDTQASDDDEERSADFKEHIFDELPSKDDFEPFVQTVNIPTFTDTRVFGFRFDKDAIEFTQTEDVFRAWLTNIDHNTNQTKYNEVFLNKEFLTIEFVFEQPTEGESDPIPEASLLLVDAISADNEDAVMLMKKGSNEDVIDMMVANNNLFFRPEGSLEAENTTLTRGDSTTLTWTTKNAETATITASESDEVWHVATSSEDMNLEVTPSLSTTYTLTVTNSNGTSEEYHVEITVNPQRRVGGGGGTFVQSGNDERQAMITGEEDEVVTDEEEATETDPEGIVLGAMADQGLVAQTLVLDTVSSILGAIQQGIEEDTLTVEEVIALIEQLQAIVAMFTR